MINSVRNTVLAILNKNNYGYISPQDFNLFAKQAQKDIFEDYFYQYNYQLNKENKRLSGTEYADITKGYEEVINIFSETKFLLHNTNNLFYTHILATTNDDYYLLNKVLVYPNVLRVGNTTAFNGTGITNANSDFIAAGIKDGDIAVNLSNNRIGFTSNITTTTMVVTDETGSTISFGTGVGYVIYDSTIIAEAEKVTHSKITLLNNSLLTKPSNLYPAYTQAEPNLSLFPTTINRLGAVLCQYIRYPRDPQWTYTTLTGGEPVFNATNPSYQDFELPLDDEYTLVLKILQFAGMSIREIQAVQFGQGLEQYEDNQEK